MKKLIFLTVLSVVFFVGSGLRSSQVPASDFCTVLKRIYEAAKEKPSMKSIRGAAIDTSGSVKYWKNTVVAFPVPYGDTAKVMQVLFEGEYECYLLCSPNKSDIATVYYKYAEKLSKCTSELGLEEQVEETYNSELKGYNKLIFQKPESEEWKKEDHSDDMFGEPGRPEISMEVTHTTFNNMYNVILTIRQ